MLSLRRFLTNRVCPTCNKVMHRSQLTTHQRRHERGAARYKKFIFFYLAPGETFAKENVIVTFGQINGQWVPIMSGKAREAIRVAPTLAGRIERRAEMLNLPTPNPGSDEAIEKGCVCAVLDNEHGYGMWGTERLPQEEKVFSISEACPIHGKPTFTKREVPDSDAIGTMTASVPNILLQ